MGVNLGTVERVLRVAAGVALIGGGLLWVHGWLVVLPVLVGAVLIFSGTIGFCHIRKFLGELGAKRP